MPRFFASGAIIAAAATWLWVLLHFTPLSRPIVAQDSPVPAASGFPGNMVLFGQGGVLYSGPDGLSVLVPDSRGQVRNVPLDQINAAGMAPGTASPLPQAAPDQAPAPAGAGQPGFTQDLPPPPQESILCQCVCPACPSPALAPPPAAGEIAEGSTEALLPPESESGADREARLAAQRPGGSPAPTPTTPP